MGRLREPITSRAGSATSPVAGTVTLTPVAVKYAGSVSVRACALCAPLGTLASEKRPPAVVVPVWPPIETPTLGSRTLSAPSVVPLPFSS